MRAVLDPNVLISAALSPTGAPARLLIAWQAGAFELLVSPLLLAELERALAYPKLREHIASHEARELIEWLERSATVAMDPNEPPPLRSADPGDDYLLTLAEAKRAILVSGDKHLLALAADLPILSPADFLAKLDS